MLGSTIFFIIFIPFLAFVLLGLSVLLGPHSPYEMKNASYECGFAGFLGQNRTEFSISFFIFGLVFLLLLTIGFVFEMAKGALAIHSKQTGYLESSNIKIDRARNSKNLYKSRSSSSVSSRKGFNHTF